MNEPGFVCDAGTFRTGIEKCTKVQKVLEPHKEKRCTGRWTNQNKVSAYYHRYLHCILILSGISTKCIEKTPCKKAVITAE